MPEVGDGRWLTPCGWGDVPHLSQQMQKELLASFPPHIRDARTKGIPSRGSGVIYPIPEEDFIIRPQPIPRHWYRGYGMDVGWNCTAVIWGAQNPETGEMWLTSEHYMGNAKPFLHARAIRKRGSWMLGAIDPSARNRTSDEGKRLLEIYQDEEHGLKLVKANNSREAGIYHCWEMLSIGQVKVFSTLTNWLAEYRLYRRDEDGKIVKEFDHAMDAWRYLMNTWEKIRTQKPAGDDYFDDYDSNHVMRAGY